MHGPKKRAGGVGAIEGVRTPSLVALKVMEETDHHLIVGKGAQEFARGMGFTIEDDLNTDASRKAWLEWKRRTDPLHYLDPIKRQAAMRQVDLDMMREGWVDPNHFYGTINCNGVNAKGEVCGVTTTSGMAWKIPGRLGDSPILGAGLYVDGEVGAAGSTGRGEANLFNLTLLPGGRGDAARACTRRTPGMEGLKRITRQHRREAPAQAERRSELQHQLLRPQRPGGLRRRVDVRREGQRELRGLHGRGREGARRASRC